MTAILPHYVVAEHQLAESVGGITEDDPRNQIGIGKGHKSSL